MIFAAGRGRRMGALGERCPKPMIEVAGRPLIDHAIDIARDAGAPRIVANVHHLPHLIEPHLAKHGIAVSREPELLDTGGGLRKALPLLGEDKPVITLNSDTIWAGPNPLSHLAAAWRDGMSALLLTVPLRRTHGRHGGGDFTLRDGRLTRGGDEVYAGAQIIDPALLHDIPDEAFSLARLWFDLARDGRLHGIEWPGEWADVGHPDGIPTAEALLARA